MHDNRPYKLGAIIPTYRHVDRLAAIIARLRAFGLPVLVVDDGNDMAAAVRIASLHNPPEGVEVERRPRNGGKGAAMKTGFRAAQRRGWTHAIQVDADGQHDVEMVPAMADLSLKHTRAVICGVPVYDASVPRARKFGRYITHVWVWIETLSTEISDSMCGFRVYPVDATMNVIDSEMIGDRMDYDTDILVHLNWRGLRVMETPISVTYPEGNVSNFDLWKDNVRITAMHTRLAIQMPVRVPMRMWRRMQKRV